MELMQLLQQRADLWRGGQRSPQAPTGEPTGYEALDSLLPGGGWPRGALTELLVPRTGMGEVSLLLPTLARLSRAGHWLAWIAPPHLPYAPALNQAGVDLSRMLLIRDVPGREAMWAMEQALRSGVCGAVLGWPETAGMKTLRRLQLAAESSASLGLLFRPPAAAREPSPAALRLRIEATPDGPSIHILKCRGGWAAGPVHCPRPHAMA